MEPAWLDGNAVAGLLAEALGEEMTVLAAMNLGGRHGALRGRGLQRQLGTPGSGPSTVTVPVATPSV